MVVKVFNEVKEFIVSCVKFSEDLNLSQVNVHTHRKNYLFDTEKF